MNKLGSIRLGVEEIPALRYHGVTKCGISDAQTFELPDWCQQSGGFFYANTQCSEKK
jgi:hypothetical protein